MSRALFSVSYAGDERPDDHTIDVDLLGPALLAFGKLIRESNFEINGKKSRSRVLVVSDFEAKCFNINFQALVGLGAQLRGLLGDDKVKTAKDILEWIGLVKPAVVCSLSLLGYLAHKNGRKVVKREELTDKDQNGFIKVIFEGDASGVTVHNHVYNLSENPKAMRATRDAFTPVGQDGISRLELRGGEEVEQTFAPEQTEAIIASCQAALHTSDEEEEEKEIQETSAWLTVYSPVFDMKADNWRFRIGTDTAFVDISETEIARNAIERGGAMVDDSYYVRLKVTYPLDKTGKRGKPTYKILSVIRFSPATPTSQTSFLD